MTRSALDHKSLLKNGVRLRSLARILVGDVHTAEDLVQETWLRAIEHPPPAGWSLRPWLASVLRNLAIQSKRGAAHRAEREAVIAREAGVQSAADTCEHIELLRALADAIQEVGDPYSEAIGLRYLEGLPPREIAARLDVPIKTVRTRLHRGLGMIRSRLDRRYAGHRQWALAIAPLARTVSWSVTTTSTAAGVAIVNTGIKAAIVVSVVLGIGLAVWQSNYVTQDALAVRPEASLGQLNAETPTGTPENLEVPRRAVPVVQGVEIEADAPEEQPEVPSVELRRMRGALIDSLESSLYGEIDPGLFLDAALLLAKLEPGAAIPEPDERGSRYPLLGTPEGMKAELWLGQSNREMSANPIFVLDVTMDRPSEPYAVAGLNRTKPGYNVTVWNDPSTGSLKSLSIVTRLGLAQLPGSMVATGLLFNFDPAKPFEPFASQNAVDENGQPSGGWPISLMLTGGPWPRMGDLQKLSQVLKEMHTKLTQ